MDWSLAALDHLENRRLHMHCKRVLDREDAALDFYERCDLVALRVLHEHPLYRFCAVMWVRGVAAKLARKVGWPREWNVRRFEPPCIRITYAKIDSEPETCDAYERGWYERGGWFYPDAMEQTPGDSMVPDLSDLRDGLTPVDMAVKYLTDEGASQDGAEWYDTRETDDQSGDETEFNYHLFGFTPAQEAEIAHRMEQR